MVSDMFLNPASADSFKILQNKVVIMCDIPVCDFGAIVNENKYWGCPILFLTRIIFTWILRKSFFSFVLVLLVPFLSLSLSLSTYLYVDEGQSTAQKLNFEESDTKAKTVMMSSTILPYKVTKQRPSSRMTLAGDIQRWWMSTGKIEINQLTQIPALLWPRAFSTRREVALWWLIMGKSLVLNWRSWEESSQTLWLLRNPTHTYT